MSFSTQHRAADLTCEPPSVPPVNLAICPDTAQQLHVQEERFLSIYTFNHIHSFRSFVKFRCCGMNFEHNKHFPAMHIWIPAFSWNCLLDVVVLAKSSALIRPLLCPTPVQDDATQRMTSATSRRQPFQKTSRTFILTVLLLTPVGHWHLPSNSWQY